MRLLHVFEGLLQEGAPDATPTRDAISIIARIGLVRATISTPPANNFRRQQIPALRQPGIDKPEHIHSFLLHTVHKMAPPSKVAIATGSVNRLVKEEASYHKESAQQEERIKKLEASEGDENKEYTLKQEVYQFVYCTNLGG